MPQATARVNDWPEDGELRVLCPCCDREVREESPYCPYCESSFGEVPLPCGHPWWAVLALLVCLAALWQLLAGL
jgi:hypothetical protein